jgi:ubiquitin carboxyl-terminal hydrolase 9/24
VWSALLKLDKQSFTPQNFFNSLTDINGVKFNPIEQKDADEFFARYLDLLEEGLKGSKESKIIKTLFEGSISNQLICIDCPHRSDRDESYVTLNLQVKNKRNIKESLENLVENEILQGDNAYNCSQCDRKVT